VFSSFEKFHGSFVDTDGQRAYRWRASTAGFLVGEDVYLNLETDILLTHRMAFE
jgi:hypothetical protein